MKTNIILLILFALTFSLSAQKVNVPQNVKEALRQKFPSAKKIEWKLKKDKNYEAEFRQNSVEIAVKFSPEGIWLETESLVKSKSIPTAVKNVVSKDFPNYKTIELQSIETPDSKELIYEIHVKKNKEVVKLQYSKDGNQLSKSVKTEK